MDLGRALYKQIEHRNGHIDLEFSRQSSLFTSFNNSTTCIGEAARSTISTLLGATFDIVGIVGTEASVDCASRCRASARGQANTRGVAYFARAVDSGVSSCKSNCENKYLAVHYWIA